MAIKVTKIIELNGLHIEPEMEEGDEKVDAFRVFSDIRGGYWGRGSTVLNGISSWLRNNTSLRIRGTKKIKEAYGDDAYFEVKQICPDCSDYFEIERTKQATKGVCTICGSGNSFLV